MTRKTLTESAPLFLNFHTSQHHTNEKTCGCDRFKPDHSRALHAKTEHQCGNRSELACRGAKALLSVWCEDLGRLLLLRHQKARNGDSTADTQPAEPSKMHQTLQKPPGPQR
ncbi:hypothetical protein AVEN_208211-1 [Araneus ventricosus]|uniref:Uncharacterized protein n=1 Tax=Araneus ventricosus TaxID=182803 RepID=A0A4Y2LHQ4_ARAVE|nr:hypothetical protein AVEN_208211-1 [Araneus ventricosus]